MHRQEKEVLFCHSNNCTKTIHRFFLQLKPETWVQNGEVIASNYKHHRALGEREARNTGRNLCSSTAAVKVYLNDIVHAVTMSIIRRVQAKIGNSLPHNVVHVGYVDYYCSRVRSGCNIACHRQLHFRNNLQPGYSCLPAAWRLAGCSLVPTHLHTLLTSFVRWQMSRLVSDSIQVYPHHWLSAAPNFLLLVTSFLSRCCTCLEQSARSCHFRTFHSSLLVLA